MKKIIALILTVILAMTVFSACGKTDETTPNTDETKSDITTVNTDTDKADYGLLTDGVLAIGSEIGYPPFEQFADDGVTPIGFDIDLANEIGKRLGLEIKFINTKFDTISEGLGVNYDVIISGYTINEERAAQMILSDPYIDNYQAIVVAADSTLTANALTDIDGHSIAFQKGTTTDEIVSDLVDTGSVKCTSAANEKILTCFQQLTQGEVEMVVCDSTVANVQLNKNPGAYKIIFQDTENPEQFGIGITKGNTALADAINGVLADLKTEGFFDELNATWFA
ncbi:MAG: transporter substrate-binding domain-containing protein [Clostridiales bacterium]|nr:transporter substrate-binding domain-containing protein [Clostridiales bacterium]